MPISVQPPRITALDSPRTSFARNFPTVPELPIKGGWGYQLEDAVVVERELLPDLPLKTLQNTFVERRVIEELILRRPEEQRFAGIRRKVLSRERVNKVGRFFDVLSVEVKAVPHAQFASLQTKAQQIGADFLKQMIEEKSIRYVATYWFDVTACPAG